MDNCKSFLFLRQYRICLPGRINGLVPRNKPIKMAVGIAINDFHENRSQLVPIEFKSGPSHVKHTMKVLSSEHKLI